MFDAGQVFDELQDRLHDAGSPPARWGRATGTHEVWLNARLPSGKTVERRGATLDIAARHILDLDLSAGDKEQERATLEIEGWTP